MNYSQVDSTTAPKIVHLSQIPNLRFWVLFVVLNGLLFLPLFILNLQDNTFLPSFSVASTDNAGINWVDVDVMSDTGINWLDIDV